MHIHKRVRKRHGDELIIDGEVTSEYVESHGTSVDDNQGRMGSGRILDGGFQYTAGSSEKVIERVVGGRRYPVTKEGLWSNPKLISNVKIGRRLGKSMGRIQALACVKVTSMKAVGQPIGVHIPS